MNPRRPAPAVVLGGRLNSLSATRSLGSRGVPVTVLDHGGETELVARSKHCERHVRDGSGRPTAEWWLEWLRQHGEGCVVLPCNDVALELLATSSTALLDAGTIPVDVNPDALRLALDKEATYERARLHGIRAPRTVHVRSPEDTERAVCELGLPCALKPVSAHRFWQSLAAQPGELERWKRYPKGVIVHDGGMLHGVVDPLIESGIAVLATEVVRGPDSGFCSYYTYLDRDGTPRLHFTKRKPRQYPIHFGDGTFHETRWQPDVAELGLRVARALGVRGICNVEFKREAATGSLVLIECNARLTASDPLERKAGLDLAWIAYRAALGATEAVPPAFPDGLCQWLPWRDWRAFLSYRSAGELSTHAWLASVARPQNLPVLDWSDLGPSRAMLFRRLKSLARRARSAGGSLKEGVRGSAPPPARDRPGGSPGSGAGAPGCRSPR